jgi:hypothetical protein
LVIFGNLVYFSPFWYIVSRKIWQPWFQLAQTYCMSFPSMYRKYNSSYKSFSSKIINGWLLGNINMYLLQFFICNSATIPTYNLAEFEPTTFRFSSSGNDHLFKSSS